MTDTRPTPPPAAAAHHERPFTRIPGRWERACAYALRAGHARGQGWCAAGERVPVYERTRWGWLAWPVPQDGSTPKHPQQIGVLTPAATRTQRLALRWLTRRPARRISMPFGLPFQVRRSTVALALIGLAVGLTAMAYGLAAGVALPAMLLAALLAEHVPERLDARARECVLSVEGADACRQLQRLACLQTYLVQAAAGSDRYAVRRSAEVGQHVLWDAAGLLQTAHSRRVAAGLAARERLMLQLTRQVTQMATPTAHGSASDARGSASAPLPHPAKVPPTTRALPHRTPTPLPQKGTPPVPQHEPRRTAPALDVYLLFAHEPYYPAGAQEINTTVVAAASLLHPRIRQPDGARIHHRLVHGRRPGEIVPLSTLTHELDGGIRWPEVGDWETVTADLLQLVRDRDCDALGLGLPEIARALVCAGPHSQIRAVDPTSGARRVYLPADRIQVLIEVGRQLAWAKAGSPLWPGGGLLPPINTADAG